MTDPSTPKKNLPDPAQFAALMGDMAERAQPLIAQAAKQYREEWSEMMAYPLHLQSAYQDFMTRLLQDPQKLASAQQHYWEDCQKLWQNTLSRLQGETIAPLFTPDKGDKRFKSDKWDDHPMFDFIKQSYLMTRKWMLGTLHQAEGLDEQTMAKLDFATRQYLDALSPTNFVMTNPDIWEETMKSNGENLIKGLQNFMDDMERGHGALKIAMTDESAFEPGKNIAVTKGDVIYQNQMMEVIQYAPASEKVYKRPLLIIPPWINKFYILDLRPDNSLVGWLVEQGHTVFMISWANPDESFRDKSFDDYLNDGLLEAINQVKKATGEDSVNTIGYCIGGTLLAIALAHLAAKGESDKIASATFLTTLLDFAEAGELKLFTDEPQIAFLESEMMDKGYLDAAYLQRTFSALRANDLVWSFVVNNYLMGKHPSAFDLLYWNNDSTNLPAKLASDYLRSMYLNNQLVVPNKLTIGGTKIDLGNIKTPSYFLSTKEDHIAPWRATFEGPKYFSGPCTFTLAGSGHIAGVVNPPAKHKYGFWTNESAADKPEDWQESADYHEGSWWPNWQKWAAPHLGDKVPARKAKKSLGPAPGTYVLKKPAA